MLVIDVTLIGKGVTRGVDEDVLHTVLFVRRHLHAPLETVVQGQVWPDLEGIGKVEAIGIRHRVVLEIGRTRQVEVASAANKDLRGRPDEAQCLGIE